VGKSSLLNALAVDDRAIVSPTAGTTRDVLREELNLDGVALTLVDTAGLRDSADPVEAEGMRRARAELARADLVLAMVDDREPQELPALAAEVGEAAAVLWLHGKCDLGPAPAAAPAEGEHLWLSARTGAGLDALRQRLRARAGGEGGGSFSARARHLDALGQAQAHLHLADEQLRAGHAELGAEELRQAQLALGQITGPLDAEGLLGRIFAGFCIGK
jgi:tRNA modification GTPase